MTPTPSPDREEVTKTESLLWKNRKQNSEGFNTFKDVDDDDLTC